MQRIVGCFLEYNGKFVILRRRADKPDGNTWGLPAGKVQPGETDREAILRELFEETGYQADSSKLEYLGGFTLGEPERQYLFVTYRVQIDTRHPVTLELAAHESYVWVTPEECFSKHDLIADFHDLLRRVGFVPAER